MKKTIVLFALSFVFVAFLSAQNDCGGLNNDMPKPQNKVSADYHDVNQTKLVDCTKPGKSSELDMYEGFYRLMGNSPDSPGISKPIYNLQMERASSTFSQSPDRGDLFSDKGIKMCCSPPTVVDVEYNRIKNN